MESDRKLSRVERLLPAALIVAGMSFVAALSFRAVFDNWLFVLAPLLGVIGATGIGLFALWKRLLIGESVGLSLLGYLGVGVIAVGGIPLPGALVALLNGATTGWLRMLDSLPPADSAGDLKALPFTAAWLGAAIGIGILHRSRRVGLPALGPLVGLAISILFSVEQRSLVLFQGALLAVLFLALVTVQYESKRRVVGETRKIRPLRIAIGVGTLAMVVFVAPIAAAALLPDPPAGRIELRQLRPSPWDPLSIPSPLTETKGFLAEGRREEVAFTITGPPVDRVAVAAMEEYDGRVWAVADGDPDAPAEFRPAGPALPTELVTDGVSEHTIQIRGLGGAWLPTVGMPERITFDGGDAAEQPRVQMNEITGTLALPDGLSDGLTYTLRSYDKPVLTADELAQAATTVDVDRFTLSLLPPGLQNAAADVVEGIDPGWGQVEALATYLRDGFYQEVELSPGHSYARIAAFLAPANLPKPVGYTEQYGAGGAVLARAVNLPSRVVMGFTIPKDRFVDGTAEVRFDDVAAWVEILTDDYGWIPVDVTPDRSQVPESRPTGKRTKVVASPNPPPPPPTTTTSTTIPLGADEAVEDQVVEEEEEAPEEETGLSGLPTIVKAGVIGVSVPLMLLLLFAFLVIALKSMRRSRRRKEPDPARRVAGAWYETLDRLRESGLLIERWATPAEVARGFSEADGSTLTVDTFDELAAQVDRAAFHAEPPDDERAEFAWEMSDAAVALTRQEKSTIDRVKMAVDPRPVLRPSRPGDPAGTETKTRGKKRSHDVE